MRAIDEAAKVIKEAEAILIAAGAGMGVDSGLPDYRSEGGFYNAYPYYRELKLNYVAMATPAGFRTDPSFAWGFFGHQLELYRNAIPHEGFKILREIVENKPGGYFVLTTNVDGQFRKAGYDENLVHECHGSIHRLQCQHPCGREVWSAESLNIKVDMTTMRAYEPLPKCRNCGTVARPNVFMFGDFEYVWEAAQDKADRFRTWMAKNKQSRIAILEIGCGTGAPSLRNHCGEFAKNLTYSRLIRINLGEEAQTTSEKDISVPINASNAICQIAKVLSL